MSPEKDRNIQFGAEIRRLRQLKGFGLREFASKAGISASYLSLIERGKVAPPSMEKIRDLAKELDEAEAELLELGHRFELEDEYFAHKNAPRIRAAKKLITYFQTLLYSDEVAPLDVNSVLALLVDKMVTNQGKLRTPDMARFMISVIKRYAETDDEELPKDLEEAKERGKAVLQYIFSMEDGLPPSEESQEKFKAQYAPLYTKQINQPTFPELKLPEEEDEEKEQNA